MCGCTRMFYQVTVASSQYIWRLGCHEKKQSTKLVLRPALCRHLPVLTTLFSPLKRSKSSRPSSFLRYKYESRLHVFIGLLIISTAIFIIIFQLIIKNVEAKRINEWNLDETMGWMIKEVNRWVKHVMFF